MKPVYVERRQNVGTKGRISIFGSSFGMTSEHYHSLGAIPVGSNIPAGRFVVNSPAYVNNTGMVGTRSERTAILPDRTGKLLMRNDMVTDFSDIISDVLNDDDEFHFIGVSGNAMNTCKNECAIVECCPIGYIFEGQDKNYWPKVQQVMDVITQGFVTVYAESDVKTDDVIHVRVEVKDADAEHCQLIGGITNKSDSGTQELGSNIRVDMGAKAGEAVVLELGGLSNK